MKQKNQGKTEAQKEFALFMFFRRNAWNNRIGFDLSH